MTLRMFEGDHIEQKQKGVSANKERGEGREGRKGEGKEGAGNE